MILLIETFILSLEHEKQSDIHGWHHVSAVLHKKFMHLSCKKVITVTTIMGCCFLTDFILNQPVTAFTNVLMADKLVCFFPKMIDEHIAFHQHIREDTIKRGLWDRGYLILSQTIETQEPRATLKLLNGLWCTYDTGYGKLLTGGGKKDIVSSMQGFPLDLACLGLLSGKENM